MDNLLLKSLCARVAALAATVLVAELDLTYYIREMQGEDPAEELLSFQFFCACTLPKDI